MEGGRQQRRRGGEGETFLVPKAPAHDTGLILENLDGRASCGHRARLLRIHRAFVTLSPWPSEDQHASTREFELSEERGCSRTLWCQRNEVQRLVSAQEGELGTRTRRNEDNARRDLRQPRDALFRRLQEFKIGRTATCR
jgi:hypothetical protein